MNASEQGYNGWSNYETWCVNLWLSNDEGLYRETLERTRDAMDAAEAEQIEHPYWSEEQCLRFGVAAALKLWVCDELAPDLGATFAADLLNSALASVDWHEIADAWIESVVEQVA
jgi:hypothetical protein